MDYVQSVTSPVNARNPIPRYNVSWEYVSKRTGWTHKTGATYSTQAAAEAKAHEKGVDTITVFGIAGYAF